MMSVVDHLRLGRGGRALADSASRSQGFVKFVVSQSEFGVGTDVIDS